jgi:hypothetical protein
LVDRLCDCAERFARRLGDLPGIEVLAQELNQVLVRSADGVLADRLVAEIQRDGTCWMSATTWRGARCVRVSVCNWRTTFADVDRSVDAVAAALGRVAPLPQR